MTATKRPYKTCNNCHTKTFNLKRYWCPNCSTNNCCNPKCRKQHNPVWTRHMETQAEANERQEKDDRFEMLIQNPSLLAD